MASYAVLFALIGPILVLGPIRVLVVYIFFEPMRAYRRSYTLKRKWVTSPSFMT